jgi:methylglutaconyl-CoA hydratase
VSGPVGYRVTGTVATITLNVPERRNALSGPVILELLAGLDRAERDEQVRCVVLSHTGPVFCSGMDLKDSTELPAAQRPVAVFPQLLRRLTEFSLPVIARVAGRARAGGLGLIAAADIALSTPDADFAVSEVRVGLVPALLSISVLPHLTSRAASALFLTGETFGAERAREIGLLTAVTEDIDLEVQRYVDMLALAEPTALARTKQLLRAGLQTGASEARYAEMSALSAEFFASPAGQEGMTAFRERRRPNWVG